MQKMTIRECEKPGCSSIRSAARSAGGAAHDDGRLALSAGDDTARESRGYTRVSVAHTYTRACTCVHGSPGTHAHTSTNGDTENGRSGIEARLIVLDNSDASADATIPGRCWPGLADWLAGSRGYSSLSLSLLSSPALLSLSFPFSLLSSPFLYLLSLFLSLAPFLHPLLLPRRYHPSSSCQPSLSSCNPFLTSRVSASLPRSFVTMALRCTILFLRCRSI